MCVLCWEVDVSGSSDMVMNPAPGDKFRSVDRRSNPLAFRSLAVHPSYRWRVSPCEFTEPQRADVVTTESTLETDILGLLFETELESMTPPEGAYLLERPVSEVADELDSMAETGALVVEYRDGATVYRLPDGLEGMPAPEAIRGSRRETGPPSRSREAAPEQVDHPPATARDARSRQVVEAGASGLEAKPAVSALLSFVVPGAGQLNNGEPGKGLAMFVGAMMMWAMLLGWVISIWSVVDAYERADD